LAISFELASTLGGEIEVESQLGLGSRFIVHLPAVYRGPGGALPSFSEFAAVGGEATPPRGRRVVLVVDDDPRLVILLRAALQPAGVEVRSAFTAEEGLAMLRKLAAGAVVFDPWRPEKPGAALLEQLPASGGDSPVVAIGLALSKDGARALAHGFGPEGGPSLSATTLGALRTAGAAAAVDLVVTAEGRAAADVMASLSGILETLR